MKRHILYCSICYPAQNVFAQELSRKYGHGYSDHAIALSEMFTTKCFEHQIDFRTTGRAGDSYFPYIKYNDLKVAVDDKILRSVLPYAMQSMDMLCRQYGYEVNFAVLERAYLSGVEFWSAYLQHYQIDLVVFFTVPHEGNDFLLYQVCKAMHVQTLIYSYSILDSRNHVIQSVEDDYQTLVQRYQELCKEYADSSVEEIGIEGEYGNIYEKMVTPQKDKTPFYMRKRFLEEQRISRYLDKYATCHKYVIDKKNSHQVNEISWKIWIKAAVYSIASIDFYITGGAVTKLFLSITNRKYVKTKRLWSYYQKCSKDVDYSKKYIYFPLHFQPECTSNPRGGGIYYQQIIPIRILAESLPNDVYIYVKEHAAQLYGAREKGFYDELCSIPNVALVKPETDTYELIQHSVAVSTLTGTAGWEGVFYQKPYIMFGYWVTQHMPGVYRVRTKEECKAAVDSILQGGDTFTLKEVKLFFKALSETEAWRLDETNKLPIKEELNRQISSNLKLFDDAMFSTE